MVGSSKIIIEIIIVVVELFIIKSILQESRKLHGLERSLCSGNRTGLELEGDEAEAKPYVPGDCENPQVGDKSC